MMKAVRPVIDSIGVRYLQMRSVESHSTLGKDKERRKKNGKERGFMISKTLATLFQLILNFKLMTFLSI